MRTSAIIGKCGVHMIVGFAYGVAVSVPGTALIMAFISGKATSCFWSSLMLTFLPNHEEDVKKSTNRMVVLQLYGCIIILV